jgi:hypothetical protein
MLYGRHSIHTVMEYTAYMRLYTTLLEITAGATGHHPFWQCLLLGALQGIYPFWSLKNFVRQII